MDHQHTEAFPPEVTERLKTYVYRLIDPRNGETFYVGKGKGNRVFAHICGEQGIEGDDLDNKMKRIRQIRLAGFEVAHVTRFDETDRRTDPPIHTIEFAALAFRIVPVPCESDRSR